MMLCAILFAVLTTSPTHNPDLLTPWARGGEIGGMAEQLQNEPQSLNPIRLQITLTPVGFIQSNQIFTTGEFTVSVESLDTGTGHAVAVTGQNLMKSISEQVELVLRSLAE